MTNLLEDEQRKYIMAWASDDYRNSPSPGAAAALRVRQLLNVAATEAFPSIADFGCGAGAAIPVLDKEGFAPVGVDIVDAGARPLVIAPLWGPLPVRVDYGMCVDVMEHIPTDFVGKTIHEILFAVRFRTFFQIAMFPDSLGASIVGEPLHLTVKDKRWWDWKFAMHAPLAARGERVSWVETPHGPDYPYYCAVVGSSR